MMERKLRRAVAKEELVALTGDYKTAVILNQLIFCQERTRDVDRFIQEEKERCRKTGIAEPMQLTRGWFYKSSEELSAETMLGLSASGMRRHLSELIERGWVHERHNPHHKWDRTKQYRVDIPRVKGDLEAIGYTLQGWTTVPSSRIENASSKIEDAVSETENRGAKTEAPASDIETPAAQNRKAIPETTTETPSESMTENNPPNPPAYREGPKGGEMLKGTENDRPANGTHQPDRTAIANGNNSGKNGIDESAILGLINQHLTGNN